MIWKKRAVKIYPVGLNKTAIAGGLVLGAAPPPARPSVSCEKVKNKNAGRFLWFSVLILYFGMFFGNRLGSRASRTSPIRMQKYFPPKKGRAFPQQIYNMYSCASPQLAETMIL